MLHEDLSYRIIGCCMELHSSLGPGLLEKCYHNGLYHELKAKGLKVSSNVPFNVFHRGYKVGEYFADLVIENKIILEVKAVKKLNDTYIAQILNYLHISGCQVGILVNFQGTTIEWKRVALSKSG